MSIFAANMLSETELYGFSCLRCGGITRSSYKVTVPGDDCETFLTLGQRESVYCPICRDMRQGEFVVLTNMNATRVVDSLGNQVYPQGLPGGTTPLGQHQRHQQPNFAAGGGAGSYPPPPPPPQQTTRQPIPEDIFQGTTLPPGTLPSPLNGSPNGYQQPFIFTPPQVLSSAFSMPSTQALEKYLLGGGGATDEEVRALKKDLQAKLHMVENALVERRKCIVCCERDKCVVLLPCKHMSMCKECSEKVKECPICKATVVDRIIPYSS